MTNGKPTLQLSTSIFFTTCFISTLHHVSSPAKRTCCQMPLFHQALPKSLFQFGKCPAKGRAQEAAMAHILTQNNKHNRDAQAPAGHKHFVHKNLLRTRPVEEKDTNKQSGARLGKKKKKKKKVHLPPGCILPQFSWVGPQSASKWGCTSRLAASRQQ